MRSITKRIETDPDAAALLLAIRAAPREATPAAQLIDRLQEMGVKPASAKSWVRKFVLSLLPVIDWPAADRKRLLRGCGEGQVKAQVAVANGQRRTRLITVGMALEACRRARIKGWGWVAGETVANAYKYPATRSAFCAAIRTDGTMRVLAREVSASKSSSPTNGLAGITAAGGAAQWRAWADATLPMTPI